MGKKIKEFAESIKIIYSSKLAEKVNETRNGMNAVLMLLDENDYLSPIEIAEKLELSRARTTILLKKLFDKNYIRFYEDESDKRKLRIEISKDGKAYISSKKCTYVDILNKMYDELGESNVRKLIALAKSINDIER